MGNQSLGQAKLTCTVFVIFQWQDFPASGLLEFHPGDFDRIVLGVVMNWAATLSVVIHMPVASPVVTIKKCPIKSFLNFLLVEDRQRKKKNVLD